MRHMDHEARLVAQNDNKFLANLTGSSWVRKAGQLSRSSSPASSPHESLGLSSPNSPSGRHSPARAQQPLTGSAARSATLQGPAGAAAPSSQPSSAAEAAWQTKQPTSPHEHQPPAPHLHTSGVVTTCSAGLVQQQPPADAAAGQFCFSATETEGNSPLCPAGQVQGSMLHGLQLAEVKSQAAAAATKAVQETSLVIGRQRQQQPSPLHSPGPCTGKAARDSPKWLVHTDRHVARSASAGARATLAPTHADRSLHTACTAAQYAPSSAGPLCSTTVPLLVHSSPASPVPAAATVACRHAGGCMPPADVVTSTPACSSSVRSPGSASQGLTANAPTCPAAAAVMAGSPCSSSHHSVRPAAVAADSVRAGMVSPEQLPWFGQGQPNAQLPCREDTQQLWQWLADELEQLRQQLQQPHAVLCSNQHHDGVMQPRPGSTVLPLSEQRKPQPDQHHTHAAAGLPGNQIKSRATGSATSKSGATSPVGNGLAGSRAASPFSRQRAQSQGRLHTGLDTTAASLDQQAQQLTELCRAADGALQVQSLQRQLDVFSAAFNQLCRQVSVGCVERGVLMTQLWAAHAAVLQAALQDISRSRLQQEAAQEAAAAAAQQQQRLLQHQEDERVALRAISERHAAKAEAAKQDYDALKQQHTKLKELLKRLSGAQQLVQRVMDLEASAQQHAIHTQHLQGQLAETQQQLDSTSTQLHHWQGRAHAAEDAVQQLRQELGCSTPRPKRDLGLLCDLVDPAQQRLIEEALVAGVPAPHVHRMLLGLSTTGQDMQHWLGLAGSCVPALQKAADPAQLYLMIRQHLADCDASSLEKYLRSPEDLQLLGQAVHLGADHETMLSLLVGSLGLPALPAASSSVEPGLKSQQNQKQARASAVAVGPAAAAAAGSIGVGLPLLPLVGVLASKYGHDARELGGPVTEALVHAQLSTTVRVHDLEAKCKSLHREVVLLKCTLAEQRKHEQERVDAALKGEKRKIARREARQPTPLEKFLQTRWGTVFAGLGLSEELPRVLRTSAPINNKHMPKREAEKLAAEIWALKDEQDVDGTSQISLAEATALFLERRFFAIPRLVTEVAYNLLYSLGQHTYDTDCNLFLRVFSGEVDQSVRHEQQLLEGEIMRMLKLLDMSINHQATGWLHKADVKTALAGFFKGKKVDRLAEILEALDTDEPGDALHYACLFTADDQFNQGMTAEIIRSQHLAERLEFLQDIEDVIRDAAEDNGTTSLTPALLAGCLRKAHKSLDSSAVSEYVTRVFGMDWQEQQHRLTQPLGAVIKAVRCGGAPHMVRRIAAPNSVAGAVSRIVPVGKFKNKLSSALKVGFSKDGGGTGVSGATAGRRMSRGAESAAAAGDRMPKSRRATQEAVSAAIAAALSGDGTKPKQKRTGKVKAEGPADDTAADAAADTGGSSMTAAVLGTAAAIGGADAVASSTAVGAAHTADTGLSGLLDGHTQHDPLHAGSVPTQWQQQGQEGSAAHGAEPINDPADDDGSCLPAASAFVTAAPSGQPPAAPQRSAAAANPMPASASPGIAGAAARMSAAGVNGRSSAAARALTVDVLSAMEAVRQSWLKEEEDRLISLGSSGAAKPSATTSLATGLLQAATPQVPQQGTSAPAAGFFAAWQSSLPGGTAVTSGEDTVAARSSVSGGVYSSLSGSSRRYTVPAVPALRLSEVLQAAAASDVSAPDTAASSCSGTGRSGSAGITYRSSMASSVRSSVRGSSWGGSSVSEGGAAQCSSRSLLQQRSVKPILSRLQSNQDRPTKHVQINTDDTVFAFSVMDVPGPASGNSPALAPATGGLNSPKRLLPHSGQVGAQQEEVTQQDEASTVAAGNLAVRQPSGSRESHDQVDVDVDADAGRPSQIVAEVVCHRGSGNSRQQGSPLPSFHKHHSIKQTQRATPDAAEPQPLKKRGSKSAKHAAALPQLLLTDADDACAAELATPAGAGEHTQVCFTPQAPEEGGKRNAVLMRRLNKGKSLKQLEEVMLAVAGGQLALE